MAGTGPRRRIRDAAIDLFYEGGYTTTSLRQLSEVVGLQLGSLYNHIASKEELLFDIMYGVTFELLDETVDAMERAGDDQVGRALAFLRTSVRFHALRQKEAFIGNTELRRLSDEHRREIVALRDRYEGLLGSALAACAAEGSLRVHDVPLATRVALSVCRSVADWYRPDGPLSLEELQTEVPRLIGPFAGMEVRVMR